MTRPWFLAALAAATLLANAPARADTDRLVPTPFAMDGFAPLDDDVLAREVGMGLGDDALSGAPVPGDTRTAVILWDESRRPITPASGSGAANRAAAHVVVTIAVGTGPGS